MLAMRTLVFASFVVGVVGTARAQPAQDPPASGAGEAPPTVNAPGATPPAPTPPPPKQPPTGTFYIGASYATDVGYSATAGISQSNLFHTGNALSLDATIGQRLQRYDMKFVDP